MDIIYSCWRVKELCGKMRRCLKSNDCESVKKVKSGIQREVQMMSEDLKRAKRTDSAFFQRELDCSKEKKLERPEMSF